MHAVEIEGVTKTFGTTVAVDGLSLQVPTGSVYGFIGPNGSGKTTTLRMIMRILHPDCGGIKVFGEDATAGEAASDRVGYLPEERGLYRKMQINELLRFYAALKGVRNCQRDIDQWLERLDLADYKRKRVESLSKGMSQKLQFIATVLHKPELVILDEPFSGLDPVNQETIKDVVLEMKRGGTTVIFSTHDMDVAERMCDFIFMIFKGRKVLDGTLESIQSRYGADTIRVRLAENGVDFSRLAGVEKVNDFGRLQELRITEGADPQEILRQLMAMARVEHFEIAAPSLYDIFVRIARPQSEEVGHA
ncbi:MAG TPA: ATP-binding cassette domain-containing protein [Phycisphaerae bacterium]|nr:ATP-binding cassette domain-containing protein [Phycisphaerae bacterium]